MRAVDVSVPIKSRVLVLEQQVHCLCNGLLGALADLKVWVEETLRSSFPQSMPQLCHYGAQ